MDNTFINNEDINKQLEKVSQILDEELSLGDSYLNSSLSYIKSSTGKMLRPAFILIGATFGKDTNKSGLLKLAACIEILHTATLIHDDIIDEAKLRRKKESVQSKYSKEYAVYMGDFLLSRCFMMLSDLDIDKETAINISKAVNAMCIGEMKQNSLRYDTNISKDDYFKIINRKTVGLFVLSLVTGAAYTDTDKILTKRLGRIGYHIGMMFQLVDDILDFNGDEATLGKDVQADIIRGYYSLPLILALKTGYGDKIKELLEQEELNIPEILAQIQASGALKETELIIEEHHKKAVLWIEKLPSGNGKDILNDVIPKLLTRIY